MPDDEVKLPAAWQNRTTVLKHWGDAAPKDEESRVVHPPTGTGIGSGKAFFFLFGYKLYTPLDQKMLAGELNAIPDDVQALCAAGYTVVVDRQARREELVAAVSGTALEGLTPAGFYWSGHGNDDGALETCDGGTVRPEDLDPAAIGPGLRVAILGACYVGAHSRRWRAALGGEPLVVGWGRPVTLERAIDFLEPDEQTSTDLDDLIRRWLLTDEPLPVDRPGTALPPPATAGGRLGELAERGAAIAGVLGGPYDVRETSVRIGVPLPEGRAHLVDVFLTDSTEPFAEGTPLFGCEADIGEITALVTPEALLAGGGTPGFGRVALVRGETEMPRMVAQSFVGLRGATDQHLAAHVYAVAARADALENTVFGGDQR